MTTLLSYTTTLLSQFHVTDFFFGRRNARGGLPEDVVVVVLDGGERCGARNRVL